MLDLQFVLEYESSNEFTKIESGKRRQTYLKIGSSKS